MERNSKGFVTTKKTRISSFTKIVLAIIFFVAIISGAYNWYRVYTARYELTSKIISFENQTWKLIAEKSFGLLNGYLDDETKGEFNQRFKYLEQRFIVPPRDSYNTITWDLANEELRWWARHKLKDAGKNPNNRAELVKILEQTPHGHIMGMYDVMEEFSRIKNYLKGEVQEKKPTSLEEVEEFRAEYKKGVDKITDLLNKQI